MPPTAPFEKRCLMFLLRPTDLLRLLEMISNPTGQFAAGALPPDVQISDVFYDQDHDFLGMMLESEFFEPVEVQMVDGKMSAAWPRAIFSLDASGDEEIADEDLWSEPVEDPTLLESAPAPDFVDAIQDAATRGFRLRALTFAAAELLQILRAQNARDLPLFPHYDSQIRVLGAIGQEQIGSWTLFLEHPDFPECKVGQDESDQMVYVQIPGEGDYEFRIKLPGATLKRRLDLNLD